MSGIGSERLPWPFDCSIGGVGVMLEPDPQSGLLVGTKLQGFDDVTPTNYSYSDQSPYAERSMGLRRMIQGMGLLMQQTADEHRYRYAIGVDCSLGGMPLKGPLWHSVSPPNLASVAGFYEALSGGVLCLFALCGRYVHLSTDGGLTWTLSKDLGANHIAIQAARFKDQGGVPVDGFYVTTSDGELWQYDGAAWHQSTITGANNICSVAGRLYIGYGSSVRNCVTSPLLEANWSGAIVCGNPAQPITWLAQLYSELYVLKTDSLITLNADGSTNDLFPSLHVAPRATNGINAAAWLNYLWFSYGDTFYKVGRSVYGFSTIDPVGSDHLIENVSEVYGPTVCVAGHESWFGYMGIYNQANGHSYILKYGEWTPQENAGPRDKFSEAIHGAITKFAGKQITALAVTAVAGPGGHPNERLLAGFADGTTAWCWLPKGTPNPAADSVCEFDTAEGDLYWPLHTGTFPADTKHFRGISVFGPTLGPALSANGPDNWLKIAYRTDQNVAYLDLNGLFEYSGQRIDFPLNTAGRQIDVMVKFFNKTTATTPVLEGFAIHEALRPAFILEYSGTIRAARGTAKRDGSVDLREPEYVRALVTSATSAGGSVTVYLPDESSQELTFNDYGEILHANNARNGLAWHIPFKAVQFRVNSLYGTIERLAPYSVGDLAIWTVAQLGDVATTEVLYGSINRLLASTIADLGGYTINELGSI